MIVVVLCSSSSHPVFPRLQAWVAQQRPDVSARLVTRVDQVGSGDILLLISCSELVRADVRQRFQATLVVHASALPRGRGWSPHIWQVLEGANKIPVTLLEAEDKVDSGAIWAQEIFELEGHELADEINRKLFDATCRLMSHAIDNLGRVIPQPQSTEVQATFYRKRTPADSALDVDKTLAEQFEILRVADPERFPNYFEYRGHRYKVRVTKER